MESQEVPMQEGVWEIMECISGNVESTHDASHSGCSENKLGSVNGSVIESDGEQGNGKVLIPEASMTLQESTKSLRKKLKRKHNELSYAVRSKFEDRDNILHMLLNSTTDMCMVPTKTDEKCFLLIDKRNICKNRQLCRKQAFDIDCNKGWNFSALKRHSFVMRDKAFVFVQKIDGVYYFPMPSSTHGKNGKKIPKQLLTRSKRRKTTTTQPKHNNNMMKLKKQPTNKEILVLAMAYGAIGCLKRKICFIEHFPVNVTPKQENLFVAEYSSPPLPVTQPCAKVPKLTGNTKISEPTGTSKQRNRPGESQQSCTGILDDVQNTIAGIGNEQTVAANEMKFVEKNDLIERHLQSQTTLEEIPVGKKENEVIVVKNDENVKREAEGKKRLYVDDCGVWKNVSVKRCWFAKADGKYHNVKHADGKYQFINSGIRSRSPALKQSDILAMRWVYASLRRDQQYRRRISSIDSFPKGVAPLQRNIAIAEYVGKYPGTNDAPHGNQKRAHGNPYVRTSSKVMKKMKEQLVSKTVSQVVADDPDLEVTPQLKKKLENLRYRNSLRVAPGSVGSTETMQDLLNLVQNNPYVQQVTFIKKKSPFVIAYTPEHINAWRSRLSKESGVRVMGVDCTMTIGPLYLTMITYLHPNLLCRHTGLGAVMLGPVLLHVDRSIHCYNSFFNHVKDQLGSHGPDLFDGITLALGSREKEPVLQALDSSFPSSKIGHCVEHLENELRTFLTSDIGLSEYEVNQITNELFSILMACKDEFDFDMRLSHLQSGYDVANPKLGMFFQKLGNNIKLNCWQPVIQGVNLMKWSVEGCPALQNIVKFAETLENVRMSSVIKQIQQAADAQAKDELLSICDDGPYVLAPHAMKYLHKQKEWTLQTASQKSKIIDGLRKQARTKPLVKRKPLPPKVT